MSTAANVETGKPQIGGAIYCAPIGTTLPTSTKDTLDEAFIEVGYISEDGVTNDNAPENTKIKAWGGDTVLSTQTNKDDTFKLTLLEALNVNVLKTTYGEDNVSGDITSGITIDATAEEIESHAWVIDMALGSVNKRIVIPNGVISSLDTITYKDDTAVSYGLTIDAIATYIESIKKTVTHREFLLNAE